MSNDNENAVERLTDIPEAWKTPWTWTPDEADSPITATMEFVRYSKTGSYSLVATAKLNGKIRTYQFDVPAALMENDLEAALSTATDRAELGLETKIAV